jgi:hypothetical protein
LRFGPWESFRGQIDFKERIYEANAFWRTGLTPLLSSAHWAREHGDVGVKDGTTVVVEPDALGRACMFVLRASLLAGEVCQYKPFSARIRLQIVPRN